MAENPFLKYVQPQAAPASSGGNPFLKYVQPQPAPAPQPEEAQFDAMGNPTGATAPAAPATDMPYGEQMANVGHFYNQLGRTYADHLSFGLADKAEAGMRTLTGDTPSYDEALKQARAESAEADKNPFAPVAAAAGLMTSAGGLVKGGISLLPRLEEAPLLLKMLGYGTEGAAYGAADKAGHTDGTLADYGNAALDGAERGAKVGAALPVVGKVLGATYRAVAPYVQKPISNLSRSASGLLGNAMDADRAGVATLPALGDTAMLPDAGPSLKGLAQGVVAKPGEGKTSVVTALEQRDAGRVQRLANDVNQNLGPAPVPSQIVTGIKASQTALRPEYGRVLSAASPVDTTGLANQLDRIAQTERGPAQKAAQQVRSMLDAVGNPGNLDQNPATLLNTRQAIDGMMSKETDTNVLRILGDARKAVDAELAAKVPGIKDVDAQFAELARQKEGLDLGSHVLDGGKTALRPVELEQALNQGAQPQGTLVGPSSTPLRIRQGVRADIDRMVGTQANDLSALKKAVGGERDWNREKMGQVFGDQPTQNVIDAISREQRFATTYSDVDRGAQTAPRLASSQAIDQKGEGIPMSASIEGVAAHVAGSIGKAVFKGIAGAKSEAVRAELGRVLSQQGPDRDRVVSALLNSARMRAEVAKAIDQAVRHPTVLRAMTSSSRGNQ